MLKHILFFCIALFLCEMNVTAYEKGGTNQYEYLKPSAEGDKNDFNKVYSKTEVEGLSLINSMTMDGKWLIFNYFFKNNGSDIFRLALSDIKIFYKNNDLKTYQGSDIINEQKEFLGLGLNPTEGECRATTKNFCLGELYVAIPEDFTNGSKILVRIPVEEQLVEVNFIFEKGWMSGDSYRNKVNQAKSENRF